jgi:lectin-like protein
MQIHVLGFLGLSLAAGGAALPGCVAGGDGALGDGALGEVRQGISFQGHDYLFVNTPKTWHEAATFCFDYNNGQDYHLVTINDADEESFLNEGERMLASDEWWIGYSDEGIEGSWVWSNGTSDFLNWAPGQPDNLRNQDCAVDNFKLADTWDDQSCGSLHPFICERDADAPITQGTFSYQAFSTNSATVNTVQRALFLTAGQLVTLGTCGLPQASGEGDTYIRLLNPSGSEIAHDDDAGGCGVLSNLSIVAPTTGTYAIHAGCFANTACSGVIAYSF